MSAKKVARIAFDFCMETLTGELLLRWMENGGAAIAIRAAWCATLAFVVAIFVLELTDTQRRFAFAFDFTQFETLVHAKLEWWGVLAGGVYAALYARFSSQWNYLASLYNQLMSSSIVKQGFDEEKLARWRAGFVEDAYRLHLCRKSMFKECVATILYEYPEVKAKVERSLGAEFKKLERAVEEATRRIRSQESLGEVAAERPSGKV